MTEITAVDYLSDLDNITASDGLVVLVKNHSSNVESEALFYVYDSNQLDTNNGGTIYNGWIAQLHGYVTPEMFGVEENVEATARLQAMTDFASDNKLKVVWKSGKTYLHNQLSKSGDGYYIDWTSSAVLPAIHKSAKSPDSTSFNLINFTSGIDLANTVTTDCLRGAQVLYVDDVSSYEVGDVLSLSTSRLYFGDNRSNYTEGEINVVHAIDTSAKTITTKFPLRVDYKTAFSISGTVASVTDAWNIVLDSAIDSVDSRYMHVELTIGSVTMKIYHWDSTTRTATINPTYRTGFPAAAAGDTYTLSYKSTVNRLARSRVRILNQNVTKEFNITAEGDNYKGIVVTGTPYVHVEGNTVNNFSYAAIEVRQSLYATVRKNNTNACNHYNLGYGISLIDCLASIAELNYATGCRRAVDVFGVGMISWDNKVLNNTVVGGGQDNRGNWFYPIGTIGNSGIGSHGGAFNTHYDGNTIIDCATALNFRGQNELATNTQVYGASDVPISTFYGGGCVIDGFTYKDGFTEKGNELPYMSATLQNYIPTRLINIRLGDDFNSQMPMSFRNIHAAAVTQCAIYIDGSGNLPIMDFNNIVVTARPLNDESTSFNFFRFNTSKSVGTNASFLDGGGNGIHWTDGQFTAVNFGTALSTSGLMLASNSVLNLGRNRYIALVAASGGLVKIPASVTTAILLTLYEISNPTTRPYSTQLMLHNADATVYQGTLGENCQLSNVALTGSTGNSGYVTVSFVDGMLYIENQRSTEIRPLIILEGVI
ncbi:MAG: hypothetical protein QM666_04490 [Acinetobacter sp.]